MPRLLDTMGRADTIVDAACTVIIRSGLPGLSLRAIAAEARISPASLSHQFTDRDRLIRVVVGRIGRRRVDEIGRRAWTEGGLGYLPADEDDVLDARVWLACCELGRGTPDVGAVVGAIREDERRLMEVLTDRSLGETGLDVVMAVVDGLTAAVCALEDPLPLGRARLALEGVLPPRRDPTDESLRSSA